MTKTIKTAQSLTEAFTQLETVLTSEGVHAPEKCLGALASLRKTVHAASELLLDAGRVEVEACIREAKAKLKS